MARGRPTTVISMIEWIRTSWLSRKNLSLEGYQLQGHAAMVCILVEGDAGVVCMLVEGDAGAWGGGVGDG